MRAADERQKPDFAGCSSCNGVSCAGRSFRIPPLKFSGWPACPDALIRAPHWRAAVVLWEASKVSPLDGWPQAYTPWCVAAILALELEHQAVVAEGIKAITNPGAAPPPGQPVRRTWRADRGGH